MFRERVVGVSSLVCTSLYDPVKTRLSESKAEAEEPANRKTQSRYWFIGYWFILPHLLATPTGMQFSLDHKRRSHKQNQCSASDSVGLVFTRSYRSTLLITTPSLVKTSL